MVKMWIVNKNNTKDIRCIYSLNNYIDEAINVIPSGYVLYKHAYIENREALSLLLDGSNT